MDRATFLTAPPAAGTTNTYFMMSTFRVLVRMDCMKHVETKIVHALFFSSFRVPSMLINPLEWKLPLLEIELRVKQFFPFSFSNLFSLLCSTLFGM